MAPGKKRSDVRAFYKTQYTNHNKLWAHITRTTLLIAVGLCPESENMLFDPHHAVIKSDVTKAPHAARTPYAGSKAVAYHALDEAARIPVDKTKTMEHGKIRYHDCLPSA